MHAARVVKLQDISMRVLEQGNLRAGIKVPHPPLSRPQHRLKHLWNEVIAQVFSPSITCRLSGRRVSMRACHVDKRFFLSFPGPRVALLVVVGHDLATPLPKADNGGDEAPGRMA